MEAARKLKVNLKLEGKPCRWCQETMQLGDEAAVCTSCEAEHHARCWDGKGGCTTPGCVNEPLKRFDKPAAPPQPAPGAYGAPPYGAPGYGAPGYGAPGYGAPGYGAPGYGAPPYGAPAAAAPPPPIPPGMMRCNYCRNAIMSYEQICPFCRAITSPDGIYHGPKTTAPGAVQALVFGIIGIFICQFIFGPLAIARANQAKNEIALNPTYGGGGLATAGMVLGIVDLCILALALIIRMGGS